MDVHASGPATVRVCGGREHGVNMRSNHVHGARPVARRVLGPCEHGEHDSDSAREEEKVFPWLSRRGTQCGPRPPETNEGSYLSSCPHSFGRTGFEPATSCSQRALPLASGDLWGPHEQRAQGVTRASVSRFTSGDLWARPAMATNMARGGPRLRRDDRLPESRITFSARARVTAESLHHVHGRAGSLAAHGIAA